MRTNSQSCNINNGLVEIIGLCNPSDTNSVITEFPYWKQMHISETLQIPAQKPDIEQINSLDLSVNIFSKHVVLTPRAYDDSGAVPVPTPNLEGKLLSGRKLIIEGQICQKLVYTADIEDQPVHSAHFYVPFSSFIVVPKDIVFTDINGNTTTVDACTTQFEVNACIEDASICILDNRSILKQVTLMLNAVPTQSC